jgi:hypothetical protein
MDGNGYELAELNMGRMLAPLDSEVMRGFVEGLEPINALADTSPGFVWRLQTEDGDATAVRAWADDMLILNLSTWASVEALADFTYRTVHREVMVQRRNWFEKMAEAYMVLWWVPAGHRPSTAEAIDRLERLRRDGPTPEAFTFRSPFPPPGTADADEATVESDEMWGCPTG